MVVAAESGMLEVRFGEIAKEKGAKGVPAVTLQRRRLPSI